MSAVVVRAMPDGVLAGERERLLAMVDILEAVPPEDVRALARRSTFTRLDARDAVMIDPDEHAERLLLLLEGRAQVYEESDHPGQGLTTSVVESGTLVGAPGLVWTPLIPATMPAEFVSQSESPMGRPAQPAELAPAYVFLASQESSYVNGETLGVTGGPPCPEEDSYKFLQGLN
jgi:hypothetical protein